MEKIWNFVLILNEANALYEVANGIFSQSYYQQVDSMTYLLSCYQLADSMTEKHSIRMILKVMSSPFI